MIFEQCGVYGWKEADENLAIASLLTGDPLLLIGNHGCAKTHAANKVAQALGRRFLVYDASKAMFEDVLGYPNVERLRHGIVEYVSSPVTIWDKEMILIDELNRAVPELQSKWLEIIRSRKIMGFPTEVKWVWAAMNPMSYSATNALDEALIGRFALFIYPPDVLQMNEADRIRVATHINGDDAPSLNEWADTGNKTVSVHDVQAVCLELQRILRLAAQHFLRLREQMPSLAEFLAKYADLLVRESKGEVALDGRRLGFIHRNLLANRAIELAKAEVLQTVLPDFVASARYVVQASIPVGLNEASIQREEAFHKMEICFDLLSAYFEPDAELSRVNSIYELLTTPDLMRKTELLLTQDLGELALSKAWTDLMAGEHDLTLLAYVALQVEARRPGTVPQELLAGLASAINPHSLSSESLPNLVDDQIEYVEEIESLLRQDTALAQLIAYRRVFELCEGDNINPRTVRETAAAIANDLNTFERLIENADRQPSEMAA